MAGNGWLANWIAGRHRLRPPRQLFRRYRRLPDRPKTHGRTTPGQLAGPGLRDWHRLSEPTHQTRSCGISLCPSIGQSTKENGPLTSFSAQRRTYGLSIRVSFATASTLSIAKTFFASSAAVSPRPEPFPLRSVAKPLPRYAQHAAPTPPN